MSKIMGWVCHVLPKYSFHEENMKNAMTLSWFNFISSCSSHLIYSSEKLVRYNEKERKNVLLRISQSNKNNCFLAADTSPRLGPKSTVLAARDTANSASLHSPEQ